MSHVLQQIGLKISKQQLQLLHDKLQIKDGKIDVEEFVQLAVLIEGGEEENMHIDVPSAHVPSETSPFVTVKVHADCRNKTQGQTVQVCAGRLEVETPAQSMQVAMYWLEAFSSRRRPRSIPVVHHKKPSGL